MASVSLDVCIRGAGVVGKVLALLLARANLRVGLVSKDVPAQDDIRCFALNASSRQLLIDLRVWPEASSTAVSQMRVFERRTDEQESGVTFDPLSAQQVLAWIVPAQALEQQLSAAMSFVSGISILPEPQDATLTVIAEGKHSQTRAETGAIFELFDYGQTALAAIVSCEMSHQSTAWQWMRGGEICALLPLGAAQPANSVALVWSAKHAHARALREMPSDAFGQELECTVSSRLGKMRLISALAAWPLSVAQALSWSGQAAWGTWVLAGDAAHALHPLAGQGLNLGLKDAKVLAATLTERPYFRPVNDMRLLRAYERTRKADAALMRTATDGLAQLFSRNEPFVDTMRSWGMTQFDNMNLLKAWVVKQASGHV